MNSINTFMEHHRLLISTLSPIHVGCGEDYEPTNYVIDNGLLYGFDTAALAGVLDSKQRDDLLKRVQGPDALLKVQSFIYNLREIIPAIATHTVLTCPQLAAKYKDRIGQQAQRQGDDRVIAQLAIPRTSYNPYTQQPVLPGTGLKGAIRTAILNALQQERKEDRETRAFRDFEKEKLAGSFETDPMRLVKVGDAQFVSHEGNLDNRVLFDTNLKKTLRSDGKESLALSVMREVVSGMNSQCFEGEITLQHISPRIKEQHDRKVPKMDLAFTDIIEAVNRFYGKLFQNELQIMKNLDCAEPVWIMTVEKLLVDLQPQIENNTLMLLRLGRHSGADGVTVEGVRKIKILQGKGTPPKTLDHATTIWLSGDTEKKKKDLTPFGWLLLEVDPQPDSPVSQKIAATLRQYNAAAYAQEMRLKEAMFAAKIKQQQVLIERAEQLAEQARKLAAAEQQQLAETKRLSNLSPEQQQIECLRKEFDELVSKNWKLDINHKLILDLGATIDKAVVWPENMKAQLIELATSMFKAANLKPENVKKRLAILRQPA